MQSILDYCAAAGTPKRDFPAGSVLLKEGETTGRLYVLTSGTIEVARGDTTITITSEPGAVFGEMSALLGRPHSADVRAVTPVTAYEIAGAVAALESHPEIAHGVARLLAHRLHAATTYLVDIKRQFEGKADHFGMIDEVLDSLVHHQPGFVSGSDRQPDPPR